MNQVIEFIHELTWEALPEAVRSQARRCLLDTLGTAIGGRSTDCSQIIHEHAAAVFGGKGATLWQDGREVSPAGAALANGMTIDSLDIHDGYKLCKGHPGAAIVPASFATLSLASGEMIDGKELLTTLVVGYEVALRAGVALHSTACDFHSSGAWNALGCAALTARRLSLDPEQTRQALGIAEYHGPRSQIMRVVDYPTMVKDGSGWGAMAGVSAGLLAKASFSGAPALTVEMEPVSTYWDDLGQTWRMLDLYFKPYAVCYWAQPAIAGVLTLQQRHQIDPAAIRRIGVHTFHQATRLKVTHPTSTDEAQYSLPFPVAAALIHHRLGPEELDGRTLQDPRVLALAERVDLIEEKAFNEKFPAQRFARVEIELENGERYDSGEVTARWEPSAPPSDEELIEKFRWLAGIRLSPTECAALEKMIWDCAELEDVSPLADALK